MIIDFIYCYTDSLAEYTSGRFAEIINKYFMSSISGKPGVTRHHIVQPNLRLERARSTNIMNKPELCTETNLRKDNKIVVVDTMIGDIDSCNHEGNWYQLNLSFWKQTKRL